MNDEVDEPKVFEFERRRKLWSEEPEWKDGRSSAWRYREGQSPYYEPEMFGLEIVVSHDWAGSYEFDQVVVWRNSTTGELRAAYDSGCSCPTPFGNLTWEKMRPIKRVEDLRVLIDAPDYEGRFEGQDEGVAKIKAAVHRALRNANG